MSRRRSASVIPASPHPILLAAILAAISCGRSREAVHDAGSDTAFASMQERGHAVMGVDQYTSSHVFENLPDGGRIVLERDSASDTSGIATIRAHMQSIATAFREGDFEKPFQVHVQVVPGTAVMAARHGAIDYSVIDRPRGAEVRIRSADTAAVAAIHAFLDFQRGAHHAGAHEHS